MSVLSAGLTGCGQVPGSGIAASDQDVVLKPGAYEIHRTENFVVNGEARSPKTTRHDVACIPASQSEKWPEMYMAPILNRLKTGTGTCVVESFTKSGNSFTGKGRCPLSDGIKLDATFEGRRGTDGFEVTVKGNEKIKQPGKSVDTGFENLYVAKRVEDC